jgi:hypothetical protein
MMIPLPPAGATCVPTGLNLGDRFQGCPSLQKIGTWNVLFPCSSSPAHDALIEINGTGQCGSGTVCCDTTPRTTECWPLFNAPVATDNKWRVVVNNRNANTSTTSCTGGCAAATTITCVTVWSHATAVGEEVDALTANFLPNVTLGSQLILRTVVVWHMTVALVCRAPYS